MWFGLRMSSKANADLVSAVADLLESTSRVLILTTSGICLAWYLVGALVGWPMASLGSTFLVALVVITVAAVALYVLPQRLLAAQVWWLVGVGGVVVLAAYLFRRPEIAFLFALLPLMAVVTVGWPAGLLAQGFVVVGVWWLSRTLLSGSLPFSYGLGIVAGGAVAGTLGWSVTQSLLRITGWALANYEQGRHSVKEMREQQLELKQTQEDLIHANRELARLSDRLRAMQQVAEEARRAKEEFVANVSHELRTPLNMIIGFSEMITQSPQIYGSELPPALLADIDAIYANSQHLARLVDDVLDLSQVEAGRMALSKEWASLPEIVDAAALAVRPLYESKGLYLDVQVPDDLPPLFCDSTRIRQVVLNLLSNAGRFTERGGVRVRAWREPGCSGWVHPADGYIRLIRDNTEARVVVSVTDTGPGIAPEDQARLFEPFQQVDSSMRRPQGGSGLGLSISKRFVEMHKGRMWLESPASMQVPHASGGSVTPHYCGAACPGNQEEGPGTTFYFSLPLETPLPTTLASTERMSTSRMSTSRMSTSGAMRWLNPHGEYEYRIRTRPFKAPAPVVAPRFVLLEEGKTLQRLFSRYLHGFETCSVQDAGSAMVELNRAPAQALIVNAPPLGETPARLGQLTDLPYRTPAITCWVPGEDEAARQLGVVRYLTKPVTRDQLLSTLEGLGDRVKRVLLVDDQPEALQLFARMLSSTNCGYRVLRAESGPRALSLLRQQRPDVMLLDLIMPGMDGFQVLQEKGREPSIRDIPVVVISSKDPTGEPIVSDSLTVTRSGGLSVRDLLGCIQALSEVLSPS